MELKDHIITMREDELGNDEIVATLIALGHPADDIIKAMTDCTEGEDLVKAIAAVETYGVLATDETDKGVDDLIRSLEEEETNLIKSDDDDDYDADGMNKDGYNKDGYDKDGMNKAGYDMDGYDKDGKDENGKPKEKLEKSFDDNEMEEIIAASKAFNSLEETVEKSMGGMSVEMKSIGRLVAAQTSLLIKSARTIGELKTTIEEFGKLPTGKKKGIIGEKFEEDEEITKSHSEIQVELTALVREGKCLPQNLGIFAVRGAAALPASVKKELGID